MNPPLLHFTIYICLGPHFMGICVNEMKQAQNGLPHPQNMKKTLSVAHLPLIPQNHLEKYIGKHHIKKSQMNLIKLPCN